MNISIDRDLTLSFFRRLPQRGSQACVPVLMYHSISDEPESGPTYYHLNTQPRRFAEQMQWLKDAGYTGTSLETALQLREPASVAITFDDGYRNFYTAAWPILCRYGFKASMYLPTASIGTGRYLTWEEVRELHNQGIQFGSHTVSHPILHTVPKARLETELKTSKQSIEDELGHPVTGFAYPYAFPQEDREFSRFLTAQLRESKYETCVTTIIGRVRPTDDPFRLKRLPVNSRDDHDLFFAKLRGSYDWLGTVQRVFRQIKRGVHP